MHRVLLVTRHFPPIVSGGARRPYLIAKGLQSAGVDVAVAAPAIPDDVNGITTPHPTPLPPLDGGAPRGPAIRNFIRAHLFLPDPDIRWSLRAIRAAQAADFRPDWVITTSPPESVHVAGRVLASRWRAGWIADFRDNWLVDPLLPQRRSGFRRAVERPIANWILSRADIVTAPSERMLEEARAYARRAKGLLLPQPAPSAWTNAESLGAPAQTTDEIVILHTGSFSLSHADRLIDPTLALFEAAKDRVPRLRLDLVGRLTRDEQEKVRAVDGIRIIGEKTMIETWEAQRAADVLLLTAAPNTEIIPGKISEYRASGRPFVVVGGGAWSKDENNGVAPLDRLLDIVENGVSPPATSVSFTAEDAAKMLIKAARRA